MLLQLENTESDNIDKLLAYAKQLNVKLSLVDDQTDNFHLPGKPLSADQLQFLIEKSRSSGLIEMTDAHQIIRRSYYEG